MDTATENIGSFFANTINDNKENFAKKDYLKANSARVSLKKIIVVSVNKRSSRFWTVT